MEKINEALFYKTVHVVFGYFSFQSHFCPIHEMKMALGSPQTWIEAFQFLLLLLDLPAPFAIVSHDLLALHLTDKGVHRVVLMWLTSFFQDHRQKVALGGGMSTRYQLLCGLPWGNLLPNII